jgi:anti-sigma-K factor RskA
MSEPTQPPTRDSWSEGRAARQADRDRERLLPALTAATAALALVAVLFAWTIYTRQGGIEQDLIHEIDANGAQQAQAPTYTCTSEGAVTPGYEIVLDCTTP